MSFFLVDDGFSSHEKVSRLLESSRADRAGIRYAALSLWVLAGSECARRRNGGRVSRILARTLLCTTGRHASQAADLLVEVGLWDRDGDGYVFHAWANRQRPRDKQTLDTPSAASQQATSSEPAGDAQQANGTQVARHQEAPSTPVGDMQHASRTQVASHGSSMVTGTSDITPLSSSSLLFHSPDPERETRAPEDQTQAPAPKPKHIARMEASLSTSPLGEHAEIARWFSEARAQGGAGRWTWDGKSWGSGYEHLDRIRIALADEPDREGTFAAAMRGFLGDERARTHGYPIAWLATDLGAYAARGADDSAERRNAALEAAEAEAREAREDYQLRFGRDPEEDARRLKRLQAAREGLRKAREAS